MLNPRHRRFFCNSGSRERVLRAPVYTPEDRCVHLEVTGVLNLHDAIQACAELTDIAQLIQRFNAGDTGALNQRVSMFGDASIFHGMSMRDLIENQRSVERFYNGISESALSALDIHNFGDFVSAALNGKINPVTPTDPVKDPPKEDPPKE